MLQRPFPFPVEWFMKLVDCNEWRDLKTLCRNHRRTRNMH